MGELSQRARVCVRPERELGRAFEDVERLGVVAGLTQHARPRTAGLARLPPARVLAEDVDRLVKRLNRDAEFAADGLSFGKRPERRAAFGAVLVADRLERLPSTGDGKGRVAQPRRSAR